MLLLIASLFSFTFRVHKLFCGFRFAGLGRTTYIFVLFASTALYYQQ